MKRPGSRVFVVAPSKINLCLHVGNKQADGYHPIQSLVAFAGFEDAIWLEPAENFSLTLCGPRRDQVPCGEDNLVLRAARVVARHTGQAHGARILLQKRIPVAAGLGGGSADAAAVMRGLLTLWNLELSRERLRELASTIGADVPVCVDSASAWMEGRGERVRRVPPLPDMYFLFVNPLVAVSTAAVFGALRERTGLNLNCPEEPFARLDSLVEYLQSTRNDLEKPAIEIAPIIAEVLDELRRLPGVSFARMSGSGATCYGMIANHSAAKAPLEILRARHPDWLIWGASLFSAKEVCVPVGAQ